MDQNEKKNDDKFYPFIVENEEIVTEEMTKDLEMFV